MRGTGTILVIGGASVDRLRAEGSVRENPGGAAIYTALASIHAGGDAMMFGFRPDPMPALFEPVTALFPWHGPACDVSELPHFDIIYDEDGDARLRSASWGREGELDPAMLPDDVLASAGLVHIAAIHGPELQMRFVEAVRARSDALISAGTYGYAAKGAPDAVRELMEATDLFFMNAFEAQLVFGHEPPPVRPGQILVVTRGPEGSDVWIGDHRAHVPVTPARPVDLTGAGDSVCGGTLAGLAAGMHPIEAVRLGAAVASVTIESPGLSGLLNARRENIRDRRLAGWRDGRVLIDPVQVERLAETLAGSPVVRPFDFVGPHLPPVGHPGTLDFLFASILHQFGFWTPREGRYAEPVYATLGGQRLKGSDYCFEAYRRALEADPNALTPAGQARLRWRDTEALFADDTGATPMPVLATHHHLARGYGRDMWELAWTPERLVAEARASGRPVRFLLDRLRHVSGYREDPLRKKLMLLLLALSQRPERFIEPEADAPFAPVVDYHIMRSCLRTGLVRVADDGLRERLVDRRLLSERDERGVRVACFEAIEALMDASGRDIGSLDFFFFQARRRCPELHAPMCEACPAEAACAKRKDLFQPVMRTTAY